MNNPVDRGSFSPDDISDWFWDIIDKCERNPDRLRSIMQGITRDDIVRFDNEFQEAAVQLLDEPFLAFMEECVSEDGAKDIADFVVSQGKDVYSNVWTHPDQIPARISSSELRRTLAGVAAKVFWERFRERIPQAIQ